MRIDARITIGPVALVCMFSLACAGTVLAQGGPPQAQPPLPPPAQAPPPPPAAPPPPPAQAQPAAPAATGDWVFTQQYGWVWMPYADVYTYVPPSGFGEPLAYLYSPSYGWTWVAAPWVWGMGPWPRFGVRGPTVFPWYQRGWWRTPSRWHYRPSPDRSGLASRGIRPAPPGREMIRPAPPPRQTPQARTPQPSGRGEGRQGERRGEGNEEGHD